MILLAVTQPLANSENSTVRARTTERASEMAVRGEESLVFVVRNESWKVCLDFREPRKLVFVVLAGLSELVIVTPKMSQSAVAGDVQWFPPQCGSTRHL